MDVELIQKVNKLAVELLAQGIASNKEEAILKAEEMLTRTGEKPIKEIFDLTAGRVPEEEIVEIRNTPVDFKEVLQENKDFLVQTIKGFQIQIGEVKKDLQALKSRIEVLAQKSEQRAFQQAPSQQGSQKVESSKPNVRTGAFASDDVSVEKMFYFGNNK